MRKYLILGVSVMGLAFAPAAFAQPDIDKLGWLAGC